MNPPKLVIGKSTFELPNACRNWLGFPARKSPRDPKRYTPSKPSRTSARSLMRFTVPPTFQRCLPRVREYATFAVSRVGTPEGDQSRDVNLRAERFVRPQDGMARGSLKAQIANGFRT